MENDRVSRPEKIAPSDISIIVQGPICGATDGRAGPSVTGRALNSIRKHFPGAELILSTWEGSDVSGLNFEVLIMSKDPGAGICNERYGLRHNVNRQIVSTTAGLKAASRKYAMKIRTDLLFTHSNCIDYLSRYNLRSNEYRLTKERILVVSTTSVNPRKSFQLPYHPCDWFYFGLKADLVDIFDIPLFIEPEFTHWFKTRKYPKNHPNFDNTARYAQESYIWYSFCKKRLNIEFDHLCDTSHNNVEISEKTFANNLVVLTPSQLGIVSLKYEPNYANSWHMYTFTEWKRLYNKYCRGELPASFDYAKVLYGSAYFVSVLRSKIGAGIRFLRGYSAIR
ncbi:MAG: hypothetical protein CO113_03415 [Elusimicrobia bacterium CG_4_9_14_3_um_filter_62_55]|nr:MAG: hypothetical protein COR54_13140 [Elusimicrobia bacterium CG22_combo_CG10-13_8_21_14_all_63_91]PJB26458.1 MAG: hypothetical protein CO113_03415 [Elusimicrobia bacterium CG_4_9_14_3_um_filter_62_55]